MGSDWQPPATEGALRMRPLSVLARPWTERSFLHKRYERLLDVLADGTRFNVVPLRELSAAPRDERVVVGLRHDVEERFPSALEIGALEAERGLRATYYVLHTARYYARVGWQESRRNEALLPGLRRLQEMGHEVGLHNDLVTLQCVHGIEPRAYLAAELEWLRGNGIDVRGTSSHGSYWTHRLRYHNNYFFDDFDELHEKFPNKDAIQVGERRCELSKGRLAEFGLEYEAYHLGEDHYFSDARFDAGGRRWHTDAIDLGRLEPGERAIVLTHPDYWDPSVARKALRTAVWSARRLVVGERSWRLH